MVELATCSWRKFRPEMGVAVRITLGKPPRWFRYEHEELRLLAPPPKVFRMAEWRKPFRAYLYRVTAERIGRALDELSEKHGGARLVLLCFEADPADCHRGEFSRWWQRQTGTEIPELSAGGSSSRDECPEMMRLFDPDEREEEG